MNLQMCEGPEAAARDVERGKASLPQNKIKDVTGNSIMEYLEGHDKACGFYSERNGKTLEGFEQKSTGNPCITRLLVS